MNTSRDRHQGFTLVELLVVIAIIAIIAGLVVPNLMQAQGEALKLQCTNNLKGIHQAAFTYSTSKNLFPIARTEGTPRAHESLNVLLKSSSGSDLEPETFYCPEGEFLEPLVDDSEAMSGATFRLNADTNSYMWVAQPTRPTQKALLSSDKYMGKYQYPDGSTHAGHDSTLVVVDTNGKVVQVERSQEQLLDKYGFDDDLVPEGLTR